MSDFDATSYFKSKLPTETIGSKLDRLKLASENKVENLRQFKQDAAEAHATRVYEEKLASKSWSGQLGLESGSFESNRVNDAASLVSGTSRLAGHIASLPVNAAAVAATSTTTEEDVAAYNRLRHGVWNKSSPEQIAADKTLLSRRNGATPQTVYEAFKTADRLRGKAHGINETMDLSGIVDQTNRNQLVKDLGKDFDDNWQRVTGGWDEAKRGDFLKGSGEAISGVASLLLNAGDAIIRNPSAAREYIIENTPQLLLGAAGTVGRAGMAASNIGYAADQYEKGMTRYAQQNNGDIPPEDVRQRMAMYAASLAIAEQVGDVAGLAFTKATGKGAQKVAANLLDAGINTAKAAGKAAVTEGLTEGYQTFAEGEVLNKPASAQDIYQGAVIGAVTGGGMSGGGRAVSEALKATPEHAAERVEEAAEKATFDKAVEEGTPEVFSDRKSKNYNPAKAIGVMMALSEKEDSTPEQRDTYLAESAKLVQKAEAQRDVLDPVKVEETINELKTELKDVDPADTKTVADYESQIAAYSAQLDDMTNSKNKVGYANDLKIAERRLKEAEAVYAGFTRMATPAPTKEELDTQLNAANSPDAEVSTKAAESLINLSMTVPYDLTPDAAKTLAENKDNGLSTEQRSFLREFSQARLAENELKGLSDVSNEILFGSERYVGIKQYREQIAQAIAGQNQTRAESRLALLGKFAADHQAKLDMAEKVPHGSQVIKEGGTWKINTGEKLGDRDLKKNGGFNIHHNSTKLIGQFQKEVEALNTAHAQLSKAVGLRFGKAGVQSSPTPAAPTEAPDISRFSLREKREREGRIDNGESVDSTIPTQSVAETPQKQKKVVLTGEERQAKIDAILSAAKANPNKGKVNPPASPSATPAASVAAASSLQDASASAQNNSKVEDNTKVTDGATEQQDEQSESPAAEVATAEEQKPVGEAGRLSILTGPKEGDTRNNAEKYADKEYNPVAEGIKQKSTNDTHKTVRPLVREHNFLSKLPSITDFSHLTGFVLEDKHIKALEHFRKTASAWNPLVKANIGKPSDKESDVNFRFRDMMQYVTSRDKEGNLITDENLLTAVAYGAYSWAIDAASAPRMDYERINKMFGREDSDYVQTTVWKENEDGTTSKVNIWDYIYGMHGYEETVANDIGNAIIKALGLTASPDAPQDILPRLSVALGSHALLLLEERKLVTREWHRHGDIAQFLKEKKGETSDGSIMFIYPDYEKLEKLKGIHKGTNGLVEKLFTAEPSATYATNKAVKFSQEYAQDTRQKIAPELRKAVEKLHKTPHTVIPDMMRTLVGLGSEAILKIAGAADLENGHIHIENRKGAEVQRKNLETQLDLMLDMMGVSDVSQLTDEQIEELSKTEWFVQGEVWKNFRVGIATRSLNQQSSKIHRYMFSRPNWTVTIDMNKPEQRLDLEVAIAAGLGIKTDEQTNVETAELLRNMLHADEKLQAAVDAMHIGLTTGKWDNGTAIADYAADKEGMMTLQTLVAYAKYLNADDSGKLTVTLLVGADGKTNGPILTHLALGAAADVTGLQQMMERGGMYKNGVGQPTHYSESRKKGLKDLYEDLASALMTRLDVNSAGMVALQAIIGNLKKDDAITGKARNLVKTPLTAFAFGSALEGSILAMENKFIASIYEKIEELSREGKSPVEFIRSLNVLTGMGDPSLKPTLETVTIGALMTNSLPKASEDALRKAFQMLMANPVKETMESYFAVFIQRRTDLNRTIRAAYSVYNAAYAAARKAYIAKLVAEDKIGNFTGKNGKKYEMHDLTVAQEEELRAQVAPLLPIAHTAFSLRTGNLEHGVYMAKHQSELSDNPLHYSAINVNSKIKQTGRRIADGSVMKARAMVRGEIDPGVAGTPYFIHSLDSANMHLSLLDLDDTLNVHDEAANSVLDIKKAAGAINRATINNLLAFSPAREALNMLERLTIAANEAVKAGTMDKEAVGTLFAEWQKTAHTRLKEMNPEATVKYPSPQQAAELVFEMALENAVHADTLRLGYIHKAGFVDQYVWEGGQYQVPQAVRDAAKQAYDKMARKISPEAEQAMYQLVSFYRNAPDAQPDNRPEAEPLDALPVAKQPVGGAAAASVVGKSVTKDSINAMPPAERAETIQKIAQAEAKMSGTGMTPFGKLGMATMVSPEIAYAFSLKPVMNRQEILRVLASRLEGAPRQILSQLARSLPANLTVTMVTPETDPATVVDLPHENSRGWFVPQKDGSNNIYVLSSAFEHSGLNAETLLHELVHATVARELINPSSKASKSLADDLTTLLKHLRRAEGAGKFSHILNGENALHELVAWGMSNADFQQWMEGVKFTQTKTTRNRLVSAMKEFIRIISLGRMNETALTALFRNTAGLFEAAAGNSSNVEINLSQVAAPDSYTTTEIYDGLASETRPLDEKDDARIRSLMASMVEKLAPIYGVFGKDVQTKTLSEASIWAAATQPGGIAPFANDALANGMGYNEQVSFVMEQVEVVTRAAISGSDGQTSLAYRELSKLYDEARETLKGKLTDTQYNFLFKIESKSDDRSDYLSRFVALGLVHPDINAALQFNTKVAGPKAASSFTERLSMIFEGILEWLAGRWTKTHEGQRADAKLDVLATQLVKIEAKRRARLNVAKNATLEAIEDSFSGVADKARDKVDGWLNSEFFKGSNNGYVRAVGSIGSLAVRDRLEYLALGFQTFNDTYIKNGQNMFASIISEMQGAKDDNKAFWKLSRMTKFLEGKRKDLITMTAKTVLQSFANKGKDLTAEQKKAITAVMLRSDMSSLLDTYGLDGLLKMMKDRGALLRAVTKTEQELAGSPQQLFYLNAAESLGYLMATGDAGIDHTLLNSYSIARKHGAHDAATVTEEQATAAEPMIDRLASLYALTYMNTQYMQDAIAVFEQEQARTDGGNGVEMVLRTHQNLQKESKARLFVEQQALMTKGYVPEIYNQYIEVQVADVSEESNMRAQGYGKGATLETDDADPQSASKKRLYTRHGTGQLPYQSGALSMTSMSTKGTTKHNGNMDLFSTQGQFNTDMMADIQKEKAKAIREMSTRRIHPSTKSKTFMVPVLNPRGDVVNHRYMMKNWVKDDVLERDNRFEQLLGAMAGSIYDKQESPKQNRIIVEALKAQYDLEFKTRAVSYVEIGPRSPDPKMREHYRMLPEATKQAIREVWKSESMYVRTDLIDINFGYRKKSLTDVLQQDRAAREGFAKLMGEVLGTLGTFGTKSHLRINPNDTEDEKVKKYQQRDAVATMRLRTFEEIWQTFVREAKDIIVVKSGSTLVGNILSNFSLLYAYGVPVTDMIRSHRIALRGAMAYNKDSEELFTLQAQIDTGTAEDMGKAKARVVQLKDAMARNPVRQLIEAGLMPTIVEDVEMDDDIYSMKSKFVKWTQEKLGEVNPHVLNVGKSLYMAHDTKLYKFMAQGAKMSDFLARYTLYQHMTTKKKDPMSVEDAVQLASDAFINYDVPTHRSMQYINDMGFIRFTKYYLRIQKVIFHLYRENPARMMSLVAMQHFFPTADVVLNSSMLSRIGNNPLEMGAAEFLFSFDDLMTVKTAGMPIN